MCPTHRPSPYTSSTLRSLIRSLISVNIPRTVVGVVWRRCCIRGRGVLRVTGALWGHGGSSCDVLVLQTALNSSLQLLFFSIIRLRVWSRVMITVSYTRYKNTMQYLIFGMAKICSVNCQWWLVWHVLDYLCSLLCKCKRFSSQCDHPSPWEWLHLNEGNNYSSRLCSLRKFHDYISRKQASIIFT